MRTHRRTAALALALALAAPAGCRRADGATDPAPAPPEARLALSFDPGADGALRAAQAAVRARPDDPTAPLELATLLVRRKREASDPRLLTYAADALAAARARSPDDPQVVALGAYLLQEDHRFAEARDQARRLTRLAPRDATGHLMLGDALLELGQYDDAVAAYQRAVDLRPDLRTYDRAAYMRWLYGDVDGARELFALALEGGSPRDPEPSAWCLVDLGALLWHGGRLGEAAAAADRALALVPGYHPALTLKARVLAGGGDPATAAALLEAVPPRLRTADEVGLLSELLAASGRAGEAAAQVAELGRRRRSEPRAVALYYARHRLEPAEAMALAERELAARPDIYSYDVYALALLRAGRVAEAGAAIDRALVLDTPDARFHLHRALIRQAAGDRAGARAARARALALDPHADPLLAAELP